MGIEYVFLNGEMTVEKGKPLEFSRDGHCAMAEMLAPGKGAS